MPTFSSDARLFGVDLHAAWRALRSGWQGLQKKPPLVWLAPSVPVRFVRVDGSKTLWRDGVPVTVSRAGGAPSPASARCVAVELPEELVLRRRLTIPAMSERDTLAAVALDVHTASPFGAQDVVFGYDVLAKHGTAVEVEVALASRRQVESYLAGQSALLVGEPAPEVWVQSARGTAIVIAGFGEAARYQQGRRWLLGAYALVLLALCWGLAIAVTPTAQLRLRAIQAIDAYTAAANTARPVVAQREELLKAVEQLNHLSEILQGRVEPLRLMDRLTNALPDDSALQLVKLQSGKVTIIGQTGNASALMQILSEQPGVRDVKAPSPATRMPGAAKENFVIEFVIDPQHYGVAMRSSVAAPVPANASAQPATPPVATPAAGASPAPVTPPVNTAPPAPGAATFGGATFGGTATRPAPGATPSNSKGAEPPSAAKP